MRSAMLLLLAGSLALTPAVAQESGNDELKKDALFLLANRRTPESSQFLRDFYQRTNDAELKKTVIFHIAQSGTEEDVSWLRDRVRDPNGDEEIQKSALFWLAQSRHTTMAQLEELYGQLENTELKEAIIFAYSQRRDTEAVDKLMQVARQDPDQKLRKSALFWLAQSRDPRVTQFLVDIVNQ
jgi:HEAT repeat protein